LRRGRRRLVTALGARQVLERPLAGAAALVGLGPGQGCAHRLAELLVAHRLGEVAHGPLDPAPRPVDRRVQGGEQHDRDRAHDLVGVGLERREDVPPVDPRHHEVEHDGIGRARRHQVERLLPGCGLHHDVAVEPEADPHEGSDAGLVVDDEDRCHFLALHDGGVTVRQVWRR
jgi:hypothetical protein